MKVELSKGRRYLLTLGMVGCVVLFSLVSIYEFIAIQNKNQTIGVKFNGAAWAAASLEVEYWRFLNELEAFVDRRSDKESLLLRFDILWSRLPIMRNDPDVGIVRGLPEYLANLSAIEKILMRVDPLLTTLTPANKDEINFVREHMRTLEQPFHSILLNTYHAWSDTLTYGEQHLNKLRYLLYASFAGILLSSLGLTTVLVRQVRFGQRMLSVNQRSLEVAKEQTLAAEREMQERQEAVNALRDSEIRIKDIADIAVDWFWEMDAELRFSYLSERYQEITGIDPAKVLGRKPETFLNWLEQNSSAKDEVMKVLHSRQAFHDIGLNLYFADGSMHKISVSGRPLFDKNGRFQGYRGVGRDVTDRVKAEQELIAAKTAAEQANASKSRFLAAASHDLRQPLQTLRLLNSVLKQSQTNAETELVAGKQAAALDSMDRMLDALLDLNRLESGSVKPQRRDFALASLLQRLESDFKELVAIKGLSFKVVYCGVWINSDPELLYTILHNLISNALKYTDRGGVLIGCRKRGDALSIEVWDTGLGIPEDRQSLIFEEFYQLDNPARDRRLGHGLGLAIVKRLSTLLEHSIKVRSRVGKGSMFSVLVPRGVKVQAASSARPHSDTVVNTISPATILCIEDDPAVLESLNILLKLQGFTIISAPGRHIALKLVLEDRKQPDLIVTDYRLPAGELGTTLIQDIDAALGCNVPAIVITGDTSQIDTRGEQRSRWRVLLKPVKGEQLIEVIQELLSNPQDTERRDLPLPRIINA